MEVFADCFAPAFRAELYPAVEEIQEILGNANDSYVACAAGGTVGTVAGSRAHRVEAVPGGPGGSAALPSGPTPSRARAFPGLVGGWCRSGGEAAFSALLENAGDRSVEAAPPQLALPYRMELPKAL